MDAGESFVFGVCIRRVSREGEHEEEDGVCPNRTGPFDREDMNPEMRNMTALRIANLS